MMDLLDVQEKILDTNAAIARLEGAIAKHPDSLSLLANIRSLRKRQKLLESSFLEAADAQGQDVCAYRLFSEGIRPTVAAFSRALEDFQHLFSVMYHVIKNGPKDTAHYGAEITADTSFGFAYTYPGSVGVVLTLPNERLLPGIASNLDRTMETVFRLAKSETPEGIAQLARELGRSPIRATYRWARSHAQHGLGADIEWRRNREIRAALVIQRPELERLHKTIDMSGEEKSERITLRGELVAANILRRTFHIVTEEDEDVRGRFDDAISEAHTVTLPTWYKAVLRKTTRILYSTETEEVEYFLIKLIQA